MEELKKEAEYFIPMRKSIGQSGYKYTKLFNQIVLLLVVSIIEALNGLKIYFKNFPKNYEVSVRKLFLYSYPIQTIFLELSKRSFCQCQSNLVIKFSYSSFNPNISGINA